MPSSAFFLRAGLALVSFTTTIFEASAQLTATPVSQWRAGKPSCVAGGDPSANGGYGGGFYVDKWGGTWDTRCSMTLSGAVYESGVATGTQGWYGCAKGCAKRPRCTAFHYQNSTQIAYSEWTETRGSGSCFYRLEAGSYSLDTNSPVVVYAAAHLIRANTQLPVSQHTLFGGVERSNKQRLVPYLQR